MTFTVETQGHYDFVNLTDRVREILAEFDAGEGILHLFVPSSTVALTLMEFEDNLIEDLKQTFEQLAPEGKEYAHHKTWGDHNGAAHIKSALVGTDLSVPVSRGELQLGAWQQIALIDFDEKARRREVRVTFIRSS
jgi:secondary thiamine-phosphate synthase enzyme